MTEDKKTTEEVDTTEEVVEEAEEKEPIAEEVVDDKKPAKKEKEIDYDAIVAEEEKRAKPDPKIARDAFKEREKKRKEEMEEDEEDTEDKPLTRAEMDKMLADNRQEVRKEFETDRATEIAKAHTSSDGEARAVIALWKTRIIPTGNLEEDVLFALGGLDRKKLLATNKELTRALKSKDGVNRNSISTQRDAPQGSEPKLSPADAQAYKLAGFVWDGKQRLYKKSLGKGKTLFKKPNGEQYIA